MCPLVPPPTSKLEASGRARYAAGVKTVLILALALTGCAGSFEVARAPKRVGAAQPPSERCIELDDRHAFWGGSSKFSAALAGASGLSTIPIEDERARIGLAAGSAVAAAIAVGADFISDSAGESWARECSTP